MIPVMGVERSKVLAEALVWIPFGGAALAATGLIASLLAWDVCARRHRGGTA
jgi:hypothetical protein